MKLFRCSIIILCLCATVAPMMAQTSVNGSLHGRVVDENDAVIADATIVLSSLETSITQTTFTDSSGQYTFGRVSPGAYSVAVEKAGFRRAIMSRVVVTVNEAAVVNFILAVGAVNEVINIEAGDSILQSQGVDVSMLVSERRVRELPLNGKNFQKLVSLSPGVAGGNTINQSVSGARTYANSYTLDGTTLNDERTPNGVAVSGGAATNFDSDGGPNPGPNLISTEAIQEYRILTSNADATFGRGSGAHINVITKSGSNEFHGSVYEFLRNDALDARDFFNTGPFIDEDGKARVPPFKQHLYGGSIGGPIVRDRHFFFGNFEGYNQKLLQTSSAILPNASLIDLIPGDLGQFYRTFYISRGIVPASGNPAGEFRPLSVENRTAAIGNGFPRAMFDGNAANGEAGTVLISSAANRDFTQYGFLIRTDHKLTDRLTALLRYGFAQPDLSTALGIPIDINQTRQRWQSWLSQFVYTLSPTQVFEFRGGLQRTKSVSGPKGGLDTRLVSAGVSSELGLVISATGTGLETIRLTGNASFIDNQTVPQFALLHTWARGNMSLRSGIDLRHIMSNVANVASSRPTYTFNELVGQSGLLGTRPGQPQAIAASVSFGSVFGANIGPTTPMRGWRSTQQEYFTQADWRVRDDLTLNLGLRYSYFGVYSEVNDAISNLYAIDSAGNIVPDVSPFAVGRTANRVAQIGKDRPLYQPDRNNFQPRLGIAWDIRGRGLTVLRTGYGIYSDRIYQIEFTNNILNTPFVVTSAATNVPFLARGEVPIIPGTSAPQFTAVDPTLRNPYTHRFNVALEQKFGANTSVSIAYVGSRGRDLIRALDPNGGASVPLQLRPDPRFARQRLITNDSISKYDSLQMFARRRFVQGIDFTVSYTYAHSNDDNSTDLTFGTPPSLLNLGADSNTAGVQGGGTQFVKRPRRADWGRSNFDVRHNLTISHLVELPFGRGHRFLSNAGSLLNGFAGGWSIAGIMVLRSGEPFSITLGRDVNDDGDASTDRPVLLGGSTQDLYANNNSDRVQYLIPIAEALTQLGVPDPITDPFAALARNAFQSPPVKFYDLSLIKRFQIKETMVLGVEINAFNIFNHANLDAPDADLSSPFFGQVTNTRFGTNPRQIQLGLKFTF